MNKADQYLDVNGLRIRYRVFKAKGKIKGRVLVLPGFTEFIEKHEDQANGFAKMGLEAVCLDWPSQGLSKRLSPKYPLLVHCDDFSQHLGALDAVVTATGFDQGELPLFVFGHSMGGHLALRYAHTHPYLAGVMLCAPMIMPPVRPGRIVKPILDFLCALGFAKLPLVFQQEIVFQQEAHLKRPFKPDNVLTRDPTGFQLQSSWFAKVPDLRVSGPSFGWVRAAYRSCLNHTANPKWLAQIKTPVEVHLAGDERVVDAEASDQFMPYLDQGKIYHYPDARHELMLEITDVRALVWSRLEAFIKSRLESYHQG